MLAFARTTRGKMVIPLIVGIVVVCSGVGVVAFTKHKSAKKSHKAGPEPVVEKLVKMEEMVVNLADFREPHYLKTSITLEVRGPKAAGETERLMPKIRDAAISVLSTQFYHDLLVPERREGLKEAIKERVNTVLTESKVVSVYFTDFAMQ